jgi:electron transfer flavoprotein beta subunit
LAQAFQFWQQELLSDPAGGISSMKILVYVRQVPDAEATVAIANGAVSLAGAKLVLDTMDEYGLEEALRFRDAGAPAEIIVAAVGPARNEEALRSALAMGADRAIHVESDIALDPIALSSVVAELVRKEEATLLFCGGRQADWDSDALGAAVAERLGWPQLTWTNHLELTGDQLTGRHDVDDGNESFTVALPAVVTTQQGLNDPRYATLPNIMKAKKKELRKEVLADFAVQAALKTVSAEMQVRARLHKILQGKDDPAGAAAQLVEMLRTEAKVIA